MSTQNSNKKYRSPITLVTGLWDINRGDLSGSWARSFQSYLDKFELLLDAPYNLIVFGQRGLQDILFTKRTQANTLFVDRDIEWFKSEFYQDIQDIRTNPEWYNQVAWLAGSPQAKLDMYNPIVMAKPYLLHDAKLLDKFDSSHLFWIDAGIANTVNLGYLTQDRTIDRLNLLQKISFIAFPYKAHEEIHGFSYDRLCQYAGKKVKKVGRGGFFGGPKEQISSFSSEYYQLMKSTLSDGLMGTEESLFSILIYRNTLDYQIFDIEANGLIYLFFENLKNKSIDLKPQALKVRNQANIKNTGLYILSFNSPDQLQGLLQSMERYDPKFVEEPEIILLDNSNDPNTYSTYQEICRTYSIEHIKKDNLGICGGRQYIAEDAELRQFDFYFFFEDDMFLSDQGEMVCKNGFSRFTPNLYSKCLDISMQYQFDFIKLSYTEFFGDNGTQWAWYNVPQEIRSQFWPNQDQLPEHGLHPDPPKTHFKTISSLEKLSFVTGEIYYSNWPQLISKAGNQKMFLKKKWKNPYEQTWMSHFYQETKKGILKPALLLLSPIEHDRFDHYDSTLRKES